MSSPSTPIRGSLSRRHLALLACAMPVFATGLAHAEGASSAATAHIVKAIKELEREIKLNPKDDHRKKALSFLLRARAQILKADDGKRQSAALNGSAREPR